MAVLEDYGLGDYGLSWQFAGNFPEKLRHAVDPGWFGELPRSYFHDGAVESRGLSGRLTREQVVQWLREGFPRPGLPAM